MKNQLIKYLTIARSSYYVSTISLFFTYISLTKYIISTIKQIIASIGYLLYAS